MHICTNTVKYMNTNPAMLPGINIIKQVSKTDTVKLQH